MLLSLSLNNLLALVISILIILILIFDIVAGYKNGFLESGVKFFLQLR